MGSTLELLEDILVYGILLCIFIFAYHKLVSPLFSTQTEGFSAQTDILPAQTRITADIATARQKSPTFFTQTSSAPFLPPNQSFLVNICPLTGYIGGYLGPPEKLMNAEYYIQTAIRAGIRSFVLPITTYVNKSKTPPNWPMSGNPVLACRDSSGIIISENGISLDNFISALIQYKSVSGYGSDPIFLTLQDDTEAIDMKFVGYVNFMKKIARALSPLDPYRLTTVASYGSVVGGTSQKELLTQIPLSAFQNKIVIFTNFDTSQDADQTLASYANFIYSNDATLPVRTIALENLVGTTVDYVTNARIHWYISQTNTPFVNNTLVAPSTTSVQLALDNGLQCIPIPFLSTPMADITDIWNLWKGASYRLKAEAARYTQPDPILPAKVSTKLNARPSNAPGQEPGTLSVP